MNMIDKNVMMLDAGMVRFSTDKPFGTALGGIMTELKSKGRVLRLNEIDPDDLPPTCGGCDLFLDWSTPLRKRYISCVLEESDRTSVDEAGDIVHHYSASLKEGHKNTPLRVLAVLGIAAGLAILGILGVGGFPKGVTTILGLSGGFFCLLKGLGPSRKAVKTVKHLLQEIKQSK